MACNFFVIQSSLNDLSIYEWFTFFAIFKIVHCSLTFHSIIFSIDNSVFFEVSSNHLYNFPLFCSSVHNVVFTLSKTFVNFFFHLFVYRWIFNFIIQFLSSSFMFINKWINEYMEISVKKRNFGQYKNQLREV